MLHTIKFHTLVTTFAKLPSMSDCGVCGSQPKIIMQHSSCLDGRLPSSGYPRLTNCIPLAGIHDPILQPCPVVRRGATEAFHPVPPTALGFWSLTHPKLFFPQAGGVKR